MSINYAAEMVVKLYESGCTIKQAIAIVQNAIKLNALNK